jgi:hypothetical protein
VGHTSAPIQTTGATEKNIEGAQAHHATDKARSKTRKRTMQLTSKSAQAHHATDKAKSKARKRTNAAKLKADGRGQETYRTSCTPKL